MENAARTYDEMGLRLDTFPHHRLKGQDRYRLRVGDYRIIYTFEIEKNVIHLLAVGQVSPTACFWRPLAKRVIFRLARLIEALASCRTQNVVAEDIFVMLLTEEKFKTFTPKPICDATKSTEVLVALSSESRQDVDELVRKAVAAGGSTYNQPQDHGFMYAHGFQDLDGHIWEVFFMEPSAIKQG